MSGGNFCGMETHGLKACSIRDFWLLCPSKGHISERDSGRSKPLKTNARSASAVREAYGAHASVNSELKRTYE